MSYKRAALVVIDGWGERAEEYGNAILQAKTPVMDGFRTEANYAVVEASGLAVGLPEGTMGNSEVGHLTIGAGAVDYDGWLNIDMNFIASAMSPCTLMRPLMNACIGLSVPCAIAALPDIAASRA